MVPGGPSIVMVSSRITLPRVRSSGVVVRQRGPGKDMQLSSLYDPGLPHRMRNCWPSKAAITSTGGATAPAVPPQPPAAPPSPPAPSAADQPVAPAPPTAASPLTSSGRVSQAAAATAASANAVHVARVVI